MEKDIQDYVDGYETGTFSKIIPVDNVYERFTLIRTKLHSKTEWYIWLEETKGTKKLVGISSKKSDAVNMMRFHSNGTIRLETWSDIDKMAMVYNNYGWVAFVEQYGV